MNIAGINLKQYEPLCICNCCAAIKPAEKMKEKDGIDCACGGNFFSGESAESLIIYPEMFGLKPIGLARINKALDDYMAGNLCPF